MPYVCVCANSWSTYKKKNHNICISWIVFNKSIHLILLPAIIIEYHLKKKGEEEKITFNKCGHSTRNVNKKNKKSK